MPRAEFATFGTETAGEARRRVPRRADPAEPRQSAPGESSFRSIPPRPPGRRGPRTAEGIALLLHDIFGERCARDWVDDPAQAVEFMQKNLHDLYLVADGGAAGSAAEIVRSAPAAAARSSCLRRIPTSESDVAAVAAGAADYHLARRPDAEPARALHPPRALPSAGESPARAAKSRRSPPRRPGSTCCATPTTASSRTPATISARR